MNAIITCIIAMSMLFVQIFLDRGIVSVKMDTMEMVQTVHAKVSYAISYE